MYDIDLRIISTSPDVSLGAQGMLSLPSVVATWIPTWTWHICTSSRLIGEFFVHPEIDTQVSCQIVNACSWNKH